jgi:hypothetical protein
LALYPRVQFDQATDSKVGCNNRFASNGSEFQTLSTIMAELSPANSDTGRGKGHHITDFDGAA